MKLLVLSNGHGEDAIAVRIIEQLQSVANNLGIVLEIAALPIVGQGYAFRKLKIPLAGRVQQMPSGGFIYMGGNPLWSDLQDGLVSLTMEQLKLVRHWGQNQGAILAVGDIVPLFYAWLSRANYAFVGTAKSEYYLRTETSWLPQTSKLEQKFASVYLPWERWLMNRQNCKAVFPRDSLTTEVLQKWSIPVYDLGNPMMDGIMAPRETSTSVQLNVLLLAGSRMPEALGNWQQILTALPSVIQSYQNCPPEKLQFLGAIAPALDLKPFLESATDKGWSILQKETQNVTLTRGRVNLNLSQTNYPEFLQRADIAIAMAGTATEQFVGLGKPTVIMPGKGPQFTPAFAEAQSRLLGCSIVMVKNPSEVGQAIASVINNPTYLRQIAQNGQRRMGKPGAAKRIAHCLLQNLLLEGNVVA